MCSLFGDGGKAAAAQNAALAAQAAQDQRDAEAKREANITAGKASIDNSFGQFDDNYYKKYQDAQLGAAEPQIADQYNVASDKLNAALEDRGVRNSSIAGGYYNTLDKTRGTAEADAASSAADATNALKNNVQSQKNNLYTLNSTGADPSTIATQAIGSATALAPNQTYTQLGDLFANVLKPVSSFVSANNYSPYGGASTSLFNLGNNASGGVKVVS
jgi:hypothetical protein